MSDIIRVPTAQPELRRAPEGKLTIFKEIQRLLLNDSHLGQYLPLLSETQQAKNVRIVNDVSYVTLETQRRQFWTYMLPKYQPFNPSSGWFSVWYAIILFVLFYYYIELGVVLTYGDQVWQAQMSFWFTVTFYYLTVVILSADVYFMLNKGYYTGGVLIMDRKRILRNYLRNHILIDIPTIIILFLCVVTQQYNMNYAKIFLFFKLYSISIIDMIYQRKLQTKRVQKTIYVIARLLIIVLFLSHFMGLIFYAMDYYILTNGIFAPEFCWLFQSTAYTGIIDEPWQIQYLYSLYWGVNTMTTISYGDIAGYNPIEVVYMLFCFILAFVIYGYVLNNIVRVILWATEVQDNFRNDLIIIDTFMRRKEISQELQRKIREYIEFLYTEESQRDYNLESLMINKLPGQLRQSLIKQAYRMFYLVLLGPFSQFPEDFLNNLIFSISEQKYAPGEIIFDVEDEQANYKLYFLQKGRVDFRVPLNNYVKHFLAKIEQNDRPFGWLQFFTGHKRRYEAVSERVSNIYSIAKKDMLSLIDIQPFIREYYRSLVDKLFLRKQYNLINLTCEVCRGCHPFYECPDQFPQTQFRFIFKPKQRQSRPAQSVLRRQHTKGHNIMKHRRKENRENIQIYYQKQPVRLNIDYRIRELIDKRMAILQEQFEMLKEKFEVDLYFDWSFYDKFWNYSNIEKIINNRGQEDDR